MRGRPPKPTVLKLISGTARAGRINDAEPTPRIAELQAPERLSAGAKEYWERIAPILYAMRILTESDEHALVALCDALADCKTARASLALSVFDEAGRQLCAGGSLTYITEGKNGPMVRPRPEVTMIADADRRVAMWLSRFGLTPSDRARVSAAPGGDDSPWDKLF